MKKIAMSLAVLALTACASQNKSVGLGAALGGGTGALVGSIADSGKNGKYRTRNKESEKKRKEAFLKGQSSRPQMEGAPPSLSTPKVETKWIDGRAIGNRYIEGHFEYIIVEPARWESSQ
jgi:hypothetical protein